MVRTADKFTQSAQTICFGRGSRIADKCTQSAHTKSTRRARLTAFHRGTCCSEPTPQLSSRTRFLGLGRGARSRWFERSRAFQRALPAPSCPRPATKSQTGHRAGRAFSRKPPGSGGDEPPPAGTALAPSAGVTGWRPFGERDSRLVTEAGTDVKRLVAATVTFLQVVIRGLDPRIHAELPHIGVLQ